MGGRKATQDPSAEFRGWSGHCRNEADHSPMRAVFQNLTSGCSFPSTHTRTEYCRFWGLSPDPVTGDTESEVVILRGSVYT